MKPILTILLTIIHVVVFAQEWQFFPKDSMRCYDNPLQDSTFIEGVDFTSYQQVDNQLEIDLGLFARFDKVTDTKWIQIKTANSNFGRKVLVNDTSVRLVFVESYNHQIHPDTFTFYTNKKVMDTWKVLENRDLRVEAEFKSVVHQGNDSLKYFMLHVTNKWNNKNFQFPMVLSKQNGLLESPIFYDILAMPNDLSQLASVEIMPYKEKTYSEFLKIEPGTENHFSFVGHYTIYEGNWEAYTNGNELRFKLNQEGVKYIYAPDSRFNVIREEFFSFSNVDTTAMQDVSGLEIWKTRKFTTFNPLPSKFRYFDFYINRDAYETYAYQSVCGRLIYHKYGGMSVGLDIGDTMEYFQISDLKYRFSLTDQYLENVGAKYSMHWSGRVDGHHRSHYVKFPDGCEVADKAWRTSSIDNTLEASLSLYPNPAHNFVKAIGAPESVKIVAIDMHGKQYNLTCENGKIDVRNLTNGLYVFALQSEGKTQYIKQLIR